MTSTLIVAPNWIGDAVMAIPFFRALAQARPAQKVTVLARRGPGLVLRSLPGLEIVERGRSLAADVRELRRRRYDEAWTLPNSFRSALLAWASGAPVRVGYDTDRRGLLLTHAVPRPAATSPQLRDYDRLLESRGIAPDFGPPRLEISKHAQRRADEALARAGVAPEFVMLAPGAAFSWTKRWPPELFGALAAALDACGLRCAVAIGPGEEALAAAVDDAFGIAGGAGHLPVVGSDLDPVELAAGMFRARAVVANDSGPMHLAAAVGTPVAALFGPTDPGRTAPSGAPARVLDRYVFCSPCFLKECPYEHECLRGIGPEPVARAVRELLALPRAPAN